MSHIPAEFSIIKQLENGLQKVQIFNGQKEAISTGLPEGTVQIHQLTYMIFKSSLLSFLIGYSKNRDEWLTICSNFRLIVTIQ